MPNNTTVRLRDGLRAVLDWITEHGDLPIVNLDYLSPNAVELTLESGRFGLLTAAANAADALTHSTITVTVPDLGRCCVVTVAGRLPDSPLEITLAGVAYDEAVPTLLASLGTPPIPGDQTWDTSAEHLRGVAEAGQTR
ncbi:MAG: hypothetical protein ACRDTZ_01160 [Pseudonocardiaceae bacterium]